MYPLKNEDMYIPITERELAANISDEEKHEGMLKAITKEKMPKFLSKIPLPRDENCVIYNGENIFIDYIKQNNIKISTDNLIKQLKDLTTEKETLIKQLEFALEMNQKLKNRNLFQRILNN